MSDLRDRVHGALSNREERWNAGLADALAAACWSDLAAIGINPANYGAARILRSDPATPRIGIHMNHAGFGRPLLLERSEATMLARYGLLGLREPAPDFDAARFEADVAQAMALIDAAPTAGDAVRALVWSITPLSVQGQEYDTSYSDPAVPFSIFIGAHAPSDGVSALRLAEGILHEAMHLQLSLMEDVVPLIGGSADRRQSPWQGRQRPTQGLLHGLFVFRVIQDWLRAADAEGALRGDDLAHAHRRLSQIDKECAELGGLNESQDLTANGRRLAQALLS